MRPTAFWMSKMAGNLASADGDRRGRHQAPAILPHTVSEVKV